MPTIRLRWWINRKCIELPRVVIEIRNVLKAIATCNDSLVNDIFSALLQGSIVNVQKAVSGFAVFSMTVIIRFILLKTQF